MPNPAQLPGEIYIHDTGQSLWLQVRGPLDRSLVQELLQVWETSRSVGKRTYFIDLKVAGMISAEGMEALNSLHASGALLLWPDEGRKSPRPGAFLTALRSFFLRN